MSNIEQRDDDAAKDPRPSLESLPSMRLGAVDWLLAGSSVGLGLALVAAPVALTPSLSSLYAMHGTLESAPAVSRLMMSPWLPPLMAAAPMAVAIYCTVTTMMPRRRRVILVLCLLVALGAAALFARSMISPILIAAGGGP